MSKPQRSILLLASDNPGRAYVAGMLKQHRVTPAGTAEEAATLLGREQFSLVIITNFGLPPWIALDLINTQRDYPVLFLSGHMDSTIESICLAKQIPWLHLPDDIPSLPGELRVALEDTIA